PALAGPFRRDFHDRRSSVDRPRQSPSATASFLTAVLGSIRERSGICSHLALGNASTIQTRYHFFLRMTALPSPRSHDANACRRIRFFPSPCLTTADRLR